jgi:hypothetical protein
MCQIRPFASVEPHVGFTLTNEHCHDNQVVPLGPMLSTLGRFRFLDKFADGGGAAKKAPELPNLRWAARQGPSA